jgi:hypothetical protein
MNAREVQPMEMPKAMWPIRLGSTVFPGLRGLDETGRRTSDRSGRCEGMIAGEAMMPDFTASWVSALP